MKVNLLWFNSIHLNRWMNVIKVPHLDPFNIYQFLHLYQHLCNHDAFIKWNATLKLIKFDIMVINFIYLVLYIIVRYFLLLLSFTIQTRYLFGHFLKTMVERLYIGLSQTIETVAITQNITTLNFTKKI